MTQLAQAASYTVSTNALGYNGSLEAAGTGIDWNGDYGTSNIAGSSLTLTVGNTKVSIDFNADDKYADENALVAGINAKLAEQDFKGGKADSAIEAKYEDGQIKFGFKDGYNTGGDSLYISGVSGALKNKFGVTSGDLQAGITSFTLSNEEGLGLTSSQSIDEYLTGKTISVTLDGVTKKFTIDDTMLINESDPPADYADQNPITEEDKNNYFRQGLQAKIDEAFGQGRVSVSTNEMEDEETGETSYSLSFTASSGSTLQVTSEAADALGLGKNGVSNYLNTSSTLGSLLGDDYGTWGNDPVEDFDTSQATRINNDVWQDETGNYLDKDGNYLEKLTINGETVGYFGKDTSMESVLSAINSSSAGVNVSYSRLTGEFSFVTQETGSGQKIEFGDDLASRLFEGNPDNPPSSSDIVSKAGTDAVLEATINGKTVSMTRSSNTVSLDGMSVTLKGTFSAYEAVSEEDLEQGLADGPEKLNSAKAVTFNSSSNADNIVDVVKSFVEQFNSIAKTLHDSYTTQPAYKNSSTHTRYEPLTDSDKEGMSETAINNYEEKAKQGMLFGDSDLSAFYSQLVSAVSPGGSSRISMEAIGLTTSYSDGVITLNLNEDELRSALDANSDSVRNVFVGTGNSGGGLLSRMKTAMDAYASTSYANPGILVNKAGSKLNSSSLLSNTLQKQIDNVQSKIETWQSKMSTKIDYYTRQYTALEKLMSTMNNQSSMLSSMMGY